MTDKTNLKETIWKVMEAELSHLEWLFEELRKNIGAKDAQAVENTGKQLVDAGMNYVSNANSIIVLDALG